MLFLQFTSFVNILHSLAARPSKKTIKVQPKSVPVSPRLRKKFKINVDVEAVDKETEKLVQNLKERLKTFDEDLDRVKAAALRIHRDLDEHSRQK